MSETPIPLCVPHLAGNEWLYVKECLDTNWVSSVGLFVDRFERAVADYVGCRHAVAAVNGTAALHVALLVSGVAPEDEVLVSDLTFIAPVNAIRYVGAWPVLIDAEPDHWQMDPQKISDFLELECEPRRDGLYNRLTGRRVKAILPVHILGHPCDMDPLIECARRYGLSLIEDASESLGARYKGRHVGSLGHIACFSFNGNKVITAGGGGMLVTDDDEWAARAKYLTTQAKDDAVEFIHGEIGYNYRLTNVQAAIGVAQMEDLDSLIDAKRRIADVYLRELASVPGVQPMGQAPWAASTWWLFTTLINPQVYGEDRRALHMRLAQGGITTRPLWQPMHLSPAHRGVQAYRCEVSERLHRDAVSLPSSAGIAAEDQRRVVASIVR